MVERRQSAVNRLHPELDHDLSSSTLDPSELSRLAADFARRQSGEQIAAVPAPTPTLKGAFPYIALVLAAGLAVFSIYQNSFHQPVAILSPQMSVVAPQPIPEPSPADRAAVLPDKLRQISNCQLESIHVYPRQGDVRALQVYNLCMTGAGFTPDYSCDTTVGVPAYNPQCWTPGKNM